MFPANGTLLPKFMFPIVCRAHVGCSPGAGDIGLFRMIADKLQIIVHAHAAKRVCTIQIIHVIAHYVAQCLIPVIFMMSAVAAMLIAAAGSLDNTMGFNQQIPTERTDCMMLLGAQRLIIKRVGAAALYGLACGHQPVFSKDIRHHQRRVDQCAAVAAVSPGCAAIGEKACIVMDGVGGTPQQRILFEIFENFRLYFRT